MIGPMLKNGLEITLEKEVISRPYIDMTLKLMNQFGADACWRSPQTLGVSPQPYSHHPFYVESDWSAASYWYEICALTPDAVIELPALFCESLQEIRPLHPCSIIWESLPNTIRTKSS